MSQPIVCQVIATTHDRGIPDASLKSHLFTISSENGFSVRDDSQEQPMLRVVNLSDPTKDTQFPMKGDAAILSENDAAICILRVPTMLQAMNLQEKKPLGRHVFEQPLNIEYWQWLNKEVLILVSSDAVYTWNYVTDAFQLRYRRDPSLVSSLQSAKVTSVCFNEDLTWSTLQVVGLDAASSTIQGCFQFQSLQHNVAKVIPGHASTLLSFKLDRHHPKCTVLAYAHKAVGQSQVDVTFIEAGAQKDAAGNPVSGFSKRTAVLPLNPSVAQKEFPLFLRASERFGFVNIITKGGCVAIFDVETTALIFQATLGHSGVFAAASSCDGGGFVAATTDGQIYRLKINEDGIVEYVLDRLRREDLAFSLSVRGNLRGGDRLFKAQFEAAFASRDYAKAAQLAREAPADTLRNASTLQRFVDAGSAPGSPGRSPVLVYLQTMLEGGGALESGAESVEMVRQLCAAGKAPAIQQLYDKKVLFSCEELGDALLSCQQDQLAVRIYSEAGNHDKVLLYLITHGKLDGIVSYTSKFPNFTPDYGTIIRKGLALGGGFSAQGVESLKNFANQIMQKQQESGQSSADQLLAIPDAFVEFGYVKEASWLVLELCKRGGFNEQTGPFQTYVLRVSLQSTPDFAEALFSKGKLHFFDHKIISPACEAAGLFQRAFEFADDDAECLRIASEHARAIGKAIFTSPEWFADYCVKCGRFELEYFGGDVQAAVDAIFNFQQALLDVEIGEPPQRIYAMHVAAAFSRLSVVATTGSLISSCCEVFEAYGLAGSDAQFNFLSAVYPSSTESSVAEQFIKCAMAAPGRGEALIKACRESNCLDPEAGFNVLTMTVAADEAAAVSGLLTICARFKLSKRLINFLCEACVKREKQTQYYHSNAQAIVEQYLSAFAPEEAAEVLSALFEAGVLSTADSGILDSVFTIDFLSRLLANQSIRDRSDIGKVAEVCLGNQKTTKIIRQMLEQRLLAGAIDTVTHTAFAKMLVETRAPETEKFLLENPYYDQKSFVRFCIASDKRRRDSFVQTMALKAALVGAFDQQRPEEIKDIKCANLLVEVAYGCGMYREFSTVLLKRGSTKAWEIALEGQFVPENEGFFTMNGAKPLQLHREALILATSQNTNVQVETLDERCLAAAMGPFARASDDSRVARCLTDFLQRAVLTPGSRHTGNIQLHNLLMIAAAKSLDPKRLKQLVSLQELNADASIVAPVLVEVGVKHKLDEYFEEAFELYRRAGKTTDAVRVLIDHMTLQRAEEFAESAQNADVWSVLAGAQLMIAGFDGNSQENSAINDPVYAGSLIVKAAANLVKAKDIAQYQVLVKSVFAYGTKYQVSYQREVSSCYISLAEYIKTIRTLLFVQGKTAQHVEVDSALMYAYVRLGAEEELESFLQLVGAAGAGIVPNKGDLSQIGDRAYGEGQYGCAKLLFQRAGAWGRLALSLLKLLDYSGAVDAARRANEQPIWRAVNATCLLAGQISLAKTAGIYLVVDQDELPGVSTFYQKNVRIAELIELLEAGIEHPQARAYTNKEQNIFTHLGLIYARYLWYVSTGPEAEKRVSRFLRSNFDKLSLPLVIKACKENFMWRDVVYLYVAAGEIDQAVTETLAHPTGFDHKQLLQICGQVTQPDLLVQLTEFYIKYHPDQLIDYLRVSKEGYFQKDEALNAKRKDFLSVDPAAVLRLAKEYEIELMIRPYLELLIDDDILDVNNQLVDIYIQSNDAEPLIKFVKKTVNFDTLKTLDRLTDSKQTPGLRRAAVSLYAQLKRFDEGMTYAVQNRFYDEASACADESGDGQRCEQLLRLLCAEDFPDVNLRKEIFAVAVARCGARARPDVVIELSWLGGMMDFAMPYLVGQMRALTDKIAEMEKKSLASAVPLGQPTDGFGEFKGSTNMGDSWGSGAW